MEKQFVPYELAVKLKELGFNEECFRGYASDGEIADYTNSFKNYNDSLFINAPLWQQAFDWFSEEHKINNFVHRYTDGQWCFEVFRDDFSDCWEMYFHTKEQARHACLEKLIELITKKD